MWGQCVHGWGGILSESVFGVGGYSDAGGGVGFGAECVGLRHCRGLSGVGDAVVVFIGIVGDEGLLALQLGVAAYAYFGV